MGNPIDLAAVRWERDTRANHHPPGAALDAISRDIASGDIDPRHILIVVATRTPDGAGATRIYQAGEFEFHGQIGLAQRGVQLVAD